ncbi:hypothetical protein CCM_04840 [Cordyceps militaris CM01]|uniref:Uncharacterized protein n=1 Tax=Cordyceps militaris (strain CM01) TaxID=983644 RepID=G3JEX3_CORMM|nr:uncharacterized protein CCM_04840 [Cordyceps militaris CM01]EGX93466.1 hypothetical protein CCM_04840 [Cordyceps militaris CM01]
MVFAALFLAETITPLLVSFVEVMVSGGSWLKSRVRQRKSGTTVKTRSEEIEAFRKRSTIQYDKAGKPREEMAKFDFLRSVGATKEAVAVLNDQPFLFTNLIVVLVGLGVQAALLWYIHYATLKPGQKKKKEKRVGAAAPAGRGGDNARK